MSAVPKEGNTNSMSSLEGIKKTTTTSLEGIRKTTTSLEGAKKRRGSIDREKSHNPSFDPAVKKDGGINGCTESTMV